MICIIGFHCNDGARCRDFLRDSKMIFSDDTEYMGYGMYFWDNESNAKFWLSEKKRKQPEITEWFIVSALINIIYLLDLTDIDESKKIDKLWQKYCALTRTKKYFPIGKKVNILFEFFNLDQEYKVIRANASYKNISNPSILEGTFIKNISRAIYCVRDKSVVYRTRLELEEKVC